MEVADDEDTLLNFQKKTKKKRADKFRIRSPRLSPNILRGVSLKKRKFSQIQHSPINGRKCLSGAPSKNHLSLGVTRRGDAVEKGSILLTKNPDIQLIPAMSRKKQESRGSPSKQSEARQKNGEAGPSRRGNTSSTRRPPNPPRKKQDFRPLPPPAP